MEPRCPLSAGHVGVSQGGSAGVAGGAALHFPDPILTARWEIGYCWGSWGWNRDSHRATACLGCEGEVHPVPAPAMDRHLPCWPGTLHSSLAKLMGKFLPLSLTPKSSSVNFHSQHSSGSQNMAILGSCLLPYVLTPPCNISPSSLLG